METIGNFLYFSYLLIGFVLAVEGPRYLEKEDLDMKRHAANLKKKYLYNIED